jgi:hypothetical protein
MFTLKFLTKPSVIVFIITFLLLVINIVPAGQSATSILLTLISVFLVSFIIALIVELIVKDFKKRTK